MGINASQHRFYMEAALAQAKAAFLCGEVPVGAVVVWHGHVIASAHNETLSSIDPTAHAEVLAIRRAATLIGNHRLTECVLYVTLEPCVMCAGAILHARCSQVVFGASDQRWGATGSVADVLSSPLLPHQTHHLGGVLAEESKKLMQSFFVKRRMGSQK